MSKRAEIQGRCEIDRSVTVKESLRPGLPAAPWMKRIQAAVMPAQNSISGIRVRQRTIPPTASTRRNRNYGDFSLEGLIEYSEDAIITKDLLGKIRSWNPAAQRMFGFKAKEIIGKPIMTIIPSDLKSEERMIISKIRDGHRVTHYETVRKQKSGRLLDVSISVSPIRDAFGTIVGAATILRDISQRKRAELALQISEERFRIIYQHAPVGLEQVAIRGNRLLEVNEYLCRLLGYSRHELLQLTNTEITDRRDLPAERKLLRQLVAGTIPSYTIEKRYLRKDGNRVWVRVTSALATGQRSPYRVSVIQDLTDQRVSEAARVEGGHRMHAVVEAAVDAIVTIDELGSIESANAATERLFGYQREELLGLNVKILMPEPYQGEHDGYLRNYLRSGKAKIIGIGREVTGMRKDGTTFPLHLSVSEVRLEGRRLFTGILHDLTNRRTLEQQIIEASTGEQRRIGQDLHDGLCQDLIGIAFQADTAARQIDAVSPRDSESVRQIATSVRHSAAQARRLSHGLNPIDLAGGGLPVALEAMAKRISDSFNLDCRFQWDHTAEVTDESTAIHLYRIAQEAVSNAIKHGKARRVHIALGRETGGIALTVKDNGIGMLLQNQKPVLVTGAGVPTAKVNGGIGMHTMRYRANMIGGVLTLRSNPHGGTRLKCTVMAVLGNQAAAIPGLRKT